MTPTTLRQYTVIRTDIDSMGFPYTVEAPGYLAADVDALLRERDDELVKLKDKAMKYNLDQLGIESRYKDGVELVDLRAKLATAQADRLPT